MTFKVNRKDTIALEVLEAKKGLNRSNVIRLAVYHLIEHEGLMEAVEAKVLENTEKEPLPIRGAVSSAG